MVYAAISNLSVAFSENNFTVTFSGIPGGCPQYELVVCEGTKLGPVLFAHTIYGDALDYELTYNGLTPGTQYIVAVRAQTFSGTQSSAWASVTTLPYVNPFSKVTGLVCERVDQGVDFAGSGPILALGNGVITETNGGGWPGGPYMAYKLADGPAAGLYVYVAEDLAVSLAFAEQHIINARMKTSLGALSIAVDETLAPGSKITAGQQIATMFNGANGIEIGWARTTDGLVPESQSVVCGSITGSSLPAGGTLIGRNMDQLLQKLGVPGANNLNLTPGGKLPANWPTW